MSGPAAGLDPHDADRKRALRDDLGHAVGLALGAGWCLWIFWACRSSKTAPVIFGLVAVGLTLLGLSVRFRRRLLAPLGLVAVFVVTPLLLLLVIHWVLSVAFVVNARLPWNSKSRCTYCRLCNKCEALIENSRLILGSRWLVTWPRETHDYYNRSELRSSSRQCHLCLILFSNLETPQDNEATTLTSTGPATTGEADVESAIDEQLFVKIRQKVDMAPDWGTLQLWVSGPSAKSHIITELEWKPKDIVPHRCHDSQTTDSVDVFDWAKSWIEQCRRGHPRCRNEFVSLQSKGYLPLRLVDVDGTNTGTVRVVSTAAGTLHSTPRVEYCALSHCWGAAAGFKLTKANISQLATGVQSSSLPQTFQDAISAANKLGIRYLWIDSLCIVQDDPAEWEAQSAKMGLVYANARCVLSATASRDSAGGCFRPRKLVHHNCSIRQTADYVLVAQTERKHQEVGPLFEPLVEKSPLTTRGWTFQERYLASRILHFCDGSVFFECCTLQAFEDRENGVEYTAKPYIQADGRLQPGRDNTDTDSSRDTTSLGRLRRLIIGTRSEEKAALERRRQEQDREAAMHAAAARMGMRGAFDFLWRFKGQKPEEQLEFHSRWFELVGEYSARQLTFGTDKAIAVAGVASIIQSNTGLTYAAGLWRELLLFNLLWIPADSPQPRPARRTPTWSWMSVDGRVTHRLPDGWQGLTELISGGALEDVERVGDLVHYAALRLTGQVRRLEPDNVHITFDIDARFPPEQLYLLPVAVFTFSGTSPTTTENAKLHGIVLRERWPARRCYARVGYFWSDHAAVVDRVVKAQKDVEDLTIV